MVKQLGGSNVEKVEEATHLVADKVIIYKFICFHLLDRFLKVYSFYVYKNIDYAVFPFFDRYSTKVLGHHSILSDRFLRRKYIEPLQSVPPACHFHCIGQLSISQLQPSI